MRIRTMPTLFLFCISLAASASLGAQEGPIKYRQGVMKGIGGHAGAIAEIAYGGVPHTAHLATHADALAALSKMVVIAFEEKALVAEDTPTRAKPEIWDKWDEFKGKVADLEKAAGTFAAAAESGDADTIGSTLDGLWDACKGCHKAFREKEEE